MGASSASGAAPSAVNPADSSGSATGSGLTIVPTFDTSVTSDPNAATIEATINAAIAVYKNYFTDPVTVAIKFQTMSDGLGENSSFFSTYSYSAYRAALVAKATTTDDTTALAHLPNTTSNPVNGNASIELMLPLARALGLSSGSQGAAELPQFASSAAPATGVAVSVLNPDPNDRHTQATPASARPRTRARSAAIARPLATGTAAASPQFDGTISLNIALMNLAVTDKDSTKYSLFAVVSHEIDEVLGMGTVLNGLSNGAATPTGAISPDDLFRYDQNGSRTLSTSATASAYFSLDGSTRLVQFNQHEGGDFSDWYSYNGPSSPQVQDAYATPGSTPVLGIELRVLDVLGYHRAAALTSLSSATRSSPAAGETYSLTVTSTTSWTANSNLSWVTVSPASGSGNGTISVTVARNTSTSSRTAIVTVDGQTHVITQAGVVVTTISPVSHTSPAAGDTYTISVTSNGAWSASSDQSWASVSPASGSNNGTVTVTVAANTSTSGRTATVTIGGQTHSLTQSGATPFVTLTPTSHTSPATGESYTISVTSNTAWSVSSNQTWATVSPASGSNNGSVTVTVAANTSTSGRTASITIGGQTHSLTQSGATPFVTLTPASHTSPATGESYAISVASNTAWSASSDQTWATVSPASGSSNGSVTITVAPNASTSSRTATITIGGQTHSLTEAGAAAFVTLAPTSHTSPSAGESYTISVASNTAWSVGSDQTWATVSPVSGNNNGTVTVVVVANTGFTDRSATITIGTQTHALTQAASTIPIASHAVLGGYIAGSTVTITSTFAYPGTATAVGWQVLLPDGWSFVSDAGSSGDTHPAAGTTGSLEWAWASVPTSPVTFTYTVHVPTTTTGTQNLSTLVIVRLQGVVNAQQLMAKPDPLPVPPLTTHSADTNHDFSLSLLELTRVIELYNTRNGTLRTGAYQVQAGTEDGFAADASRAGSTSANLTLYHSADENHDGAISLLELTRVIELYNYRSGTTRTGQYHVQAGTEDGFAAGP